MPPRRCVPSVIWETQVFWTHCEKKEYLKSTESHQDSIDVVKYLVYRGPVSCRMYDELVKTQMQINPKKKKFTLKNFKIIFCELKKLYNDERIKWRTHLVLRNEKMMKIFLEDFQNQIRMTISHRNISFDGKEWKVPEVNQKVKEEIEKSTLDSAEALCQVSCMFDEFDFEDLFIS